MRLADGPAFGSLELLGKPRRKKVPVLVLDPEEIARAHQLFQDGAAEQMDEFDPLERAHRPAPLLRLASITPEYERRPIAAARAAAQIENAQFDQGFLDQSYLDQSYLDQGDEEPGEDALDEDLPDPALLLSRALKEQNEIEAQQEAELWLGDEYSLLAEEGGDGADQHLPAPLASGPWHAAGSSGQAAAAADSRQSAAIPPHLPGSSAIPPSTPASPPHAQDQLEMHGQPPAKTSAWPGDQMGPSADDRPSRPAQAGIWPDEDIGSQSADQTGHGPRTRPGAQPSRSDGPQSGPPDIAMASANPFAAKSPENKAPEQTLPEQFAPEAPALPRAPANSLRARIMRDEPEPAASEPAPWWGRLWQGLRQISQGWFG